MNVNQFLSSLTNLEKTRNFNVFKEYTLDGFRFVLDSFGLLTTESEIIRLSVVGTNGKGSTAHFISRIFLSLEKFSPVGLYTSPHLLLQNERIQVNGKMISDDWMENKLNSFSGEALEKLKTLSYFEFFTLLSILYFKDNGCKTEIYEAGLGGRLDATKLINPNIVILTKIALDHTEILGDTEEKILQEKLQIVGTNTELLFTFLQGEILNIAIENFCKEKKIKLIVFPYQVDKDYLSFNKEFSLFIVSHILSKKFELTLNRDILSGIHSIPGRMQILRNDPILIYDIGHNPSAVFIILESLKILYPTEKGWNICVGSLKDKDSAKILEILVNHRIVQRVFQIVGENWNSINISHPKIEHIREEELISSIGLSPSVVLGSFRLYHHLKKNEF